MHSKAVEFDALSASIRYILRNAHKHEWSLQGFGMFRCYLSEQYRLHVWDDRFRFEDVSTIHTHPWSFTSIVVSGRIRDQQYFEFTQSLISVNACRYNKQKIRCGEGGCAVSEPEPVTLAPTLTQDVMAPYAYSLQYDTVHDSDARDGTVTLVKRTFQPDRDHAFVYWPANTEWVSAEPRPATADEVDSMSKLALERWR